MYAGEGHFGRWNVTHALYQAFGEEKQHAIEARQLDALVDDAPTLTSLVEANHAGSIDILPRTFQRQDYALALPTASPLREPINQILARRVGDLQGD